MRSTVSTKELSAQKLKQEEKLIKEFRHDSTVMMVRASEEVLRQVGSAKVRHLILRTIARLLLKTSRRSDLIAHYDDGLCHTHAAYIFRECQDGLRTPQGSGGEYKLFVGDQEIMLDVEIGIARVDLDRSTEQTIVCALEGLTIAKKGEACGVCPQDIEIR
ncbi:hypothetical protein NNO_0093 [Hydrogenimonas sp.]|nr:hypothetical protein NNO_0093 [Hydrogenimonas sp.]